ncbi:MAG: n-acetylglutamate synthase [Pseudomonadota bacterium]
MIDYTGRLFRAVSPSDAGDVTSDTLFRYDQRGNVLMGTYSGGDIEFGSLLGKIRPDGALTFLYQHVTKSGLLRSGRCDSRPEILPNGKIRLHEDWQWTSGLGAGGVGTSILEEV